MTTAAVGVLKAVHAGHVEGPINRITKDVVAFHARDFDTLAEKLQLDLHEPPTSQVSTQQKKKTFIPKICNFFRCYIVWLPTF